jgi:PAS domain S-box-containing protein
MKIKISLKEQIILIALFLIFTPVFALALLFWTMVRPQLEDAEIHRYAMANQVSHKAFLLSARRHEADIFLLLEDHLENPAKNLVVFREFLVKKVFSGNVNAKGDAFLTSEHNIDNLSTVLSDTLPLNIMRLSRDTDPDAIHPILKRHFVLDGAAIFLDFVFYDPPSGKWAIARREVDHFKDQFSGKNGLQSDFTFLFCPVLPRYQLFAQQLRNETGVDLPENAMRLLHQAQIDDRVFSFQEFVFVQKVVDAEMGLSWLSVRPKPTFSHIFNDYYFEFLAFISIILLFATLAILMLRFRYSKPANEFLKVAYAVSRFDFSQRISHYGNDELGLIAKAFNQMVESLKQYKKMNIDKLLDEQHKLKSIIDQSLVGTLILDLEGGVVTVNKRFLRWSDITLESVLGKNLKEVIRLRVFSDMFRQLEFDQNKKYYVQKEIIWKREDGSDRVLHVQMNVIFSKSQNPIAVGCILRDISREKDIDRMKSQIVSTVAHELRSPLTSVIGYSEMLLDDDFDARTQREFLTIINAEANRLSEFVNEYLDLARIESGKSLFNLEDVDMAEIIEESLHMFQIQAKEKKIETAVEIATGIPKLSMDRDLFSRAVQNLISNALKYSPEGTRVSIQLTMQNNQIILRVKDQGYGISDHNLEKLFGKFFRVADNPNLSGIKGTGLGLAFVKEVVEKHRGNIRVKSKLNVGSEFIIQLPFASGKIQ